MNPIAQHREAVEFFQEHPGAVLDESPRKAPVEFAVEQWLEVLPEMKGLFREHWQEIALDHAAIKLDPDYERYAQMAAVGMLHLCTARADGWIVGYHLSIINSHLHYRSSLTCFTDVFYLRPEYRSGLTGYRLLKFFRDTAKARGVQKIYMMTKLHLDIGPILERLGFKPIERTYSMVF